MDSAVMRGRLIEAREMKKMKRTDVSRALGIPYRTITNYENGKREPGHDYIIRLANLCNVTADWLLGRSDNPFGDAPVVLMIKADRAARLASACKALTDEAVDRVVAYAEDLTWNPSNRRPSPPPDDDK